MNERRTEGHTDMPNGSQRELALVVLSDTVVSESASTSELLSGPAYQFLLKMWCSAGKTG
jgi:hypothetical protein